MNFLYRCFIAMVIVVVSTMTQGNANVLARSASDQLQQDVVTYQDISSGYKHTCALSTTGKLVCWGSNAYGQIGSSTSRYEARSTPGPVPGLESETIAGFTASGYNACIINSAGALKCWGTNNSKELGNPQYTNWASGTPVQVTGMESGVVQAGMGNGYICARKDIGAVYCWGLDYAASQGGEQVTRPEPVLVHQFANLKDLQVNGGHACVITSTDEVMCWGLGEWGQLGNGGYENSTSPILVSGLENVTSLAAGDLHTCAITGATESNPAKAWCWGNNQYGQLGFDPGMGGSGLPVAVEGLTGEPVAVAAGKNHSCAIVRSGGANSVMCWGRNDDGQLGSGGVETTHVPAAVPNSTGAVDISAGEYHTNILTNTGKIKSWGGNGEGQLGNGFFFRRQLPLHINAMEQGWKEIVSGEKHTCGLTNAGGVFCWGGNEYGQLGNDSTFYSTEPVQAIGLESGVASVAAGPYYTCALLTTSEAKCWGYNTVGVLGSGDPSDYVSIPAHVLLDDSAEVLSGITSIQTGGWHACALMETGEAKCWGSNNFGQLGSGKASLFEPYPVNVTFPGKFISITAGIEHTCAVSELGEVYCWGDNPNGELGIGSSDLDAHLVPTKVIGLEGSVVDVDAGANRTCILTSAGGVRCWGGSSNQHTPVSVPGLQSGVAAISTGGSIEYLEYHTCALMAGNGAVKCWGYNNYAQLGDGTYRFFGQNNPVNVLGLSGNVSAISTGATSSCAMFESGSAACWGSDYQIKTEPVDLVEVDNLGRPPSIFFSNYYEGAPESYFVITGLYFPPNRLVEITINDDLVGTVLANETGVFKFFAYFDAVGAYTIRVSSVEESNQSIGTNGSPARQIASSGVGQGELMIDIKASSTPRLKEGDGFTLGVDIESSTFIPVIIR